MDYDIITSSDQKFTTPSSKPASPGIIYATPQSFQRGLSVESQNEESRKIGRPTSMPPLPDIDYKLPRTKVATSRQSSYAGEPIRPITPAAVEGLRQKSTRKAIRTPSGRHMTASEYLRGGYRPSEKSLREEQVDDDGVQRFFVKLKN